MPTWRGLAGGANDHRSRGLGRPTTEAVLSFVIGHSSRKVNTGVKVNTGIFAKGGPFVDLKNQNFRACGARFLIKIGKI